MLAARSNSRRSTENGGKRGGGKRGGENRGGENRGDENSNMPMRRRRSSSLGLSDITHQVVNNHVDAGPGKRTAPKSGAARVSAPSGLARRSPQPIDFAGGPTTRRPDGRSGAPQMLPTMVVNALLLHAARTKVR